MTLAAPRRSRLRGAAAARALAAAAAVFTLAALAALAGCESKPSFNAVDITGASYAQDFKLTDTGGAPRSLADYRGKVVALFFGYTQCPDVCPTTMADLAQVKTALGPAGDRLQVLFVTLDPERDTPPLLASYVPNFDKSFVGLWGNPDQIARTAKDFKVFYQKVPGESPGSYTLDHTAGTFVFDPAGRIRLFIKYGQPVPAMTADLRQLLAAG
jgi:protein SCO1